MKRIIIALLALPLAGCFGRGEGVRVEYQRVNVPVACVAPEEVPAKPAALPPRPEDARAALDVATAKLVEVMGPKLDGSGGYVGRASALLRGCSGVVNTQDKRP